VTEGREQPVIDMHDSQNLFSPDALFGGWQVSVTLDAAITQELLAPVIVVGIDNTGARFDEYTQVTDVIDGMTFGGRADEYGVLWPGRREAGRGLGGSEVMGMTGQLSMPFAELRTSETTALGKPMSAHERLVKVLPGTVRGSSV
jgi:hypothetical protein